MKTKKIILFFAFLAVFALSISFVRADCTGDYNTTVSVGGTDYCTDSNGWTTSNIKPETTPPTIRNNFDPTQLQNLGGEFRADGTVNLPGGGTVSGSGTVDSSGNMKLGTDATLTTPRGETVSGDVTYNTNSKTIDYGQNGGQFSAGGYQGKFYSANDVKYDPAKKEITGVPGEGCILPNNVNPPPGVKFIIKLSPEGNSITLEGCAEPCNVNIYGQLTPTDNSSFKFNNNVTVDTGKGKFEISGGVECSGSGDCYVPVGGIGIVNGVKISDRTTDVKLVATSDPNFIPPEHSVTFYNFDDPGQRKLTVKNTIADQGITAEIVKPGLFGFEEGDTLALTASNGYLELAQDWKEVPTLRMQGKSVIVENNAHMTGLQDGKIYAMPTPPEEAGNAVGMHVEFYNEEGEQLKTTDGNPIFVDYNNVNAGNESLFSAPKDFIFGPGWFFAETCGDCTKSAGVGEATSLITGMQPATSCFDYLTWAKQYILENPFDKAARLLKFSTEDEATKGYFDINNNERKDDDDPPIIGAFTVGNVAAGETKETYYVTAYYEKNKRYADAEDHIVLDSQGNPVDARVTIDINTKSQLFEGRSVDYEYTSDWDVTSEKSYEYAYSFPSQAISKVTSNLGGLSLEQRSKFGEAIDKAFGVSPLNSGFNINSMDVQPGTGDTLTYVNVEYGGKSCTFSFNKVDDTWNYGSPIAESCPG